MKNRFWELIWLSFQEIQGFWLGFLSLVITIILGIFTGKTPVPLYFFLILGSVSILLIFTLWKAVDKSLKEYQKIKHRLIPKILIVRRDPATNSEISCLLEYSEIFGNDMYVSFYYTDEDGFEILIGVGFIENIQNNGKIRAILDKPISVHQNIIDRLVNNDRKILDKTIVKPGFPRSFSQP